MVTALFEKRRGERQALQYLLPAKGIEAQEKEYSRIEGTELEAKEVDICREFAQHTTQGIHHEEYMEGKK